MFALVEVRTWRMSSISCVVIQLTVMVDKSMPVLFSRPFLTQTFSLNQMQCGGILKECFSRRNSIVSAGHIIQCFLCVVLCLPTACWSPGHENMKDTKSKKGGRRIMHFQVNPVALKVWSHMCTGRWPCARHSLFPGQHDQFGKTCSSSQ